MNLLALLIILILPFSAFAEENTSQKILALQRKFEEYSDIAKSGGWTQIADGKAIKPDNEDQRVQELYERLTKEGYLKSVMPSPTFYSDEMVAAIMDFQSDHNLVADGVVGKLTIKALNVSAEDRAKQIQRNIERLHQLPYDLGVRYILVNIAGFNLKAMENGKEAINMRIIAGQSYHPTPLFSSEISEVIFHPYWYATDRLSYEYVFPKIKKNQNIAATHGYELFKRENGRRVKVSLGSVNLNKLTREDFDHYMFRQKPGLNNAMGSIKFPLEDNKYIYLHDTPAKELFANNIRSFSNGCIRLENPLELAKFVLRGKEDWPESRIEEIYNNAKNLENISMHIKLDKPIPVYILYLTANVDDSGRLRFYDDVYGLDSI